MIYYYSVKHSHGEASGSVEASSSHEASEKVTAMYGDQDFPTATIGKDGKVSNERVGRTEVVSIDLYEPAPESAEVDDRPPE